MNLRPWKKLGVIALGGGFNGAISVGYWKYLCKKKIVPDYVQLISVNVLNGIVIISTGNYEELERWWTKVIAKRGPSFIFDKENMFRFCYRVLFGDHLFSSKGIEFLIKHGTDIREFFRSSIYTEIVTNNESQRELNFFNNRDTKLALMPDIFLASVALVPGFKPVLINNNWHSDALCCDLERAIKYGCDTIIIMRNDHDQTRRPKHWLTRLTSSESELIDKLTDKEIRLVKLLHPECQIIELATDESLPFLCTNDFRAGTNDIQQAINCGYKTAERIINI